MRTCPYCAEQIPEEVSVCPYCEKTSPAILNNKGSSVTDSLESLKAQKEALEKRIYALNQEKLRLLENELRNETKNLEKIQDAIIQDEDEIAVQSSKTNTTFNLPTDGCFPEGFTGHDYQDEVEGKQASGRYYSNVDHDHSFDGHQVVSHVSKEVDNYGKDPGDPDQGKDGKVLIWGIILLVVTVLAVVIYVASVIGGSPFSQPTGFGSVANMTSNQVKTTKLSTPTLQAYQQRVTLVCLPDKPDSVKVYIYPDRAGSPPIGLLPDNQCYPFIDSSDPNWIHIDPRGWVQRTYLTDKDVILNDDEIVDSSGRVIKKTTPSFELPINVCIEGQQELRVGPAEYYYETYTLYDRDCIILTHLSADLEWGGSDTGAWMPVTGIQLDETDLSTLTGNPRIESENAPQLIPTNVYSEKLKLNQDEKVRAENTIKYFEQRGFKFGTKSFSSSTVNAVGFSEDYSKVVEFVFQDGILDSGEFTIAGADRDGLINYFGELDVFLQMIFPDTRYYETFTDLANKDFGAELEKGNDLTEGSFSYGGYRFFLKGEKSTGTFSVSFEKV
jgi:hypothetical protein